MKDYEFLRVGDLVVDNCGICEVTEVDGDIITAKTVIPKDIFVEAYNKYIKGDTD